MIGDILFITWPVFVFVIGGGIALAVHKRATARFDARQEMLRRLYKTRPPAGPISQPGAGVSPSASAAARTG